MLNLGSFCKRVDEHKQQQQQQQHILFRKSSLPTLAPIKNYSFKELFDEEDEEETPAVVAAAAASKLKSRAKQSIKFKEFLTFGEAVAGVKSRYGDGDIA